MKGSGGNRPAFRMSRVPVDGMKYFEGREVAEAIGRDRREQRTLAEFEI